MFKRIDHVELVPKDFAASLAFYIDALDFTLASRYAIPSPVYGEAAMLTHGEVTVELMHPRQPLASVPNDSTYGYRLPAWEVDDMATVLAVLADRGVAATWGPRELGDSIRAEISDPDGNPIELRQWLNRAPRNTGAAST